MQMWLCDTIMFLSILMINIITIVLLTGNVKQQLEPGR